MKTIPPAETFIVNKLEETQPNSNKPPTPKQVGEWMIEFAKLHVTQALKQASKKATAYQLCKDDDPIIISENSILTAYSLDDIE